MFLLQNNFLTNSFLPFFFLFLKDYSVFWFVSTWNQPPDLRYLQASKHCLIGSRVMSHIHNKAVPLTFLQVSMTCLRQLRSQSQCCWTHHYCSFPIKGKQHTCTNLSLNTQHRHRNNAIGQHTHCIWNMDTKHLNDACKSYLITAVDINSIIQDYCIISSEKFKSGWTLHITVHNNTCCMF